MNIEHKDNHKKTPKIEREIETEAIDRLLEETGSYNSKESQQIDDKSGKKPELDDEETDILSEDLYELVEENDDVIIYKIPEQPQENRKLDIEDSDDQVEPKPDIQEITTKRIEVNLIEDDDFVIGNSNEVVTNLLDDGTELEMHTPPKEDAPKIVEDNNSDFADNSENPSFMDDAQIELERLQLMIEEGEIQDEVIHGDNSQELMNKTNEVDSIGLDGLIEESLNKFLLENEDSSIFNRHQEQDEIEEELDFESIESKTKSFSTDEIINDPIIEDIGFDLLEDAPYFVQEKNSVQTSDNTIINDIEQFKKDRGIEDSLDASAKHLEDETSTIASNSKDSTLETESIAKDFEDPFTFVSENDDETLLEDSLSDQLVYENLDYLEDDTDFFNKLGSDVIRNNDTFDRQIIEENVNLNDSFDDMLILRDSIKSTPERFTTDADSKIIAEQSENNGKLQQDIFLEDQVGQTTEAFLVSEARKADSEVIDKLYEANDYGILRFDEDEDFKLTEADIQKEMKIRFGHTEGSKAERMIVQYTLMKQKFKKLQVAHKRVVDAMKKAKQYQQQMMPKTPKNLPRLEFGALYKPAEQVSGDFYDFINLSKNRWAVAIGDSAGHGIAPALIMTVTKKLLSVFIREGATIDEAMIKTNYYVTQNIPTATFITAVAGIVDLTRAKFSFVRAGHPAIMLYNPKERGPEPIAHSPNGMALGMDSGKLFNASLEEETIDLIPGDLIVMFTDGVFEISDMNRKRFGMKRFMNLIKDFGSGKVSFLMRKINNSLQEFRAGSTQDDDLSVICLKYLNDH